MAAPSEPQMMTTAPGASDQRGPRRHWRGNLCQCCGDCSTVDFGACCMVAWIPCLAYGQNMRKAFSLSFIGQTLIVLGCLYGVQFVVGMLSAIDCGAPPVTAGPLGNVDSSEVDSSDTPAMKGYEACMAKWNIIYLLYIPFTICFLLYAGYRRNQMRAKFNIPGDEYEDYLYWLCCGPCVMCQETRTLSYNSVEDGVWPESGEKQPILGGNPKSA